MSRPSGTVVCDTNYDTPSSAHSQTIVFFFQCLCVGLLDVTTSRICRKYMSARVESATNRTSPSNCWYLLRVCIWVANVSVGLRGRTQSQYGVPFPLHIAMSA